jgi:hypothetical protein
VTAEPAVTPRHGARAGARRPAADLSAIRRSDALIELLASRRRIGARVLRDPAVTLLRSLAADADATASPGRLAGPRRRAGRHHAPGARPHAAAAAVAAVFAIAAAVAAAALVIAGALGDVLSGRRHTGHKSRA